VKIIANKDIDDDLLQRMIKIEHEVFGDQSEDIVTYRHVHDKRDGGLFCLVDDDGTPIGFADAIFLSDEQKKEYLNDGNFRILKNIGPKAGTDNNLYLFGFALKKEYRNTGIVKMFVRSFATWLGELGSQGVKMKYTFSEAWSLDGARFLQAMGMIPIDKSKISADGQGFYYSPDNLAEFTAKVLRK